MHAYNNILVREHQQIFKETCLLLTLTQFSPQAPNVTNSLYQYIFSETVYACVCVCVCVCVCTQMAAYFHVILQGGHMMLGSLCLIQGRPVERAWTLISSPGFSCKLSALWPS